MLSPLDNIRPSDLLAQYTEWIYFTLVLIFFISIAGLALRKQFEKPYVKALIITVGFMMTVGVFMMRDKLAMIFEGWGILGKLLLVFVAATIPYGLCRGFGMQANRAFYVVYILFYILSWVKFPDVYYYLGGHNMGLVNLGLLILFIYALYKIVTMRKVGTDLSGSLNIDSPLKKGIGQEVDIQDKEVKILEQQENKMTRLEIKTISDIEASITEMVRIIQASNMNLATKDRTKIAETLRKISKNENVFLKSLQNLKQILHRLRVLDDKQIQEMKNRLVKSIGQKKEALEKEIYLEEEKIKTEQNVIDLEQKLEQGVEYFNSLLRQVIKVLNSSIYPTDSIQPLSQAQTVLKDIVAIIAKMKALEDKLVQLSKGEKNLLNKERKEA